MAEQTGPEQTMGRTCIIPTWKLEKIRPDVAMFCTAHYTTPLIVVVRENGDVCAWEGTYFSTGALVQVARSLEPLVTGEELGGQEWIDQLMEEGVL